MVQISEQESVVGTVEKTEKENLLQKYDIPIAHLDFEYIKNCNDAKEIEQIVQVLRSGQEGYYPDLTKCAETRLEVLKPNSKLLKTSVPILSKYDLSKTEWESLSSDIQNWVEDINKNDKELESFQNIKTPINNVPIRQSKTNIQSKKTNNKKERIKSMDYDSWDKLDVDAEMLKMDLAEEKMKKEALKKVEEKEKLNKIVLDPDVMTQAELKHAAEQAKNAGNESFKLKDYEDALQYYTNSIMILPTAIGFNNRAITHLNLKKYKEALNDCNEVLKIEPFNEKALLRKALALKHLQNYEKALEILEKIIRMNPNDIEAQKMINSIKSKIGDKPIKTVRLKIEEKSSDDVKLKTSSRKKEIVTKSKFKTILIPIPSTSTYMGPFYTIESVPIEIAEKFEKTTKITPANSDKNVIDLNKIKYVQRKKSAKNLDVAERMSSLNINLFASQMLRTSADVENNDDDEDDLDIFGDFEPTNPYEFLKYWQAIKNDTTYIQHEKLLRFLISNNCQLNQVLGNKMDGDMLSHLIRCLASRFKQKDDIPKIINILTDLTQVERFNLIMLLMSRNDREILCHLLNKIHDSEHHHRFDGTIYEQFFTSC